jgi:uncharacterized protein (TIGR04255 family)
MFSVPGIPALMSESTSTLLDPGRPPLIEVAMTVQFEPLEAFKSPQIGLLWGEAFRSEFPKVEEQPPIEHVIEVRQRRLIQPGRPQVKVLSQPETPRFFFVNETGNELLQIQPDRLSFNWRRRREYDYRRYPSSRESFQSWFTSLCRFIEREKLGEVVPDQCELVYVNHVLYPAGAAPHRRPGDLIEPFDGGYSQLAGANLEDMRLQLRHTLSGDSGEFLGRIYVEMSPGFTADGKTPLYKVQFTARGAPLDTGLRGSLNFLDLAHDRLLRAFQEFMSDRVQREWMDAYER